MSHVVQDNFLPKAMQLICSSGSSISRTRGKKVAAMTEMISLLEKLILNITEKKGKV